MVILNTKEVIELLKKYKFKQEHVHHTWKPNYANFNGKNHLALQQGMKNYHINSNGWSDIGQHLTLFPDGKWVTGRKLNVTPASIKGHNTGALCIEMLGDFDIGKDAFGGRQKDAMMEVTKYFGDTYGYDRIMFHNEASGKTCPGSSINKESFISDAKKFKVKEDKPMDKDKIIRIETNGEPQEVAGELVNGVTYIYLGTTLVPLREACETLGLIVGWNASTRTVTIN